MNRDHIADEAPVLASWLERVGGFAIDQLIYLSLEVAAVVLGVVVGTEMSAVAGFVVGLAGLIATTVFSLWQMVLVQGRTGATIGKRAVGIALVDEQSALPPGAGVAFGRGILHLLDALPFYVGFLWPLWDRNRQTFADKIVHTVVVRSPLPVGQRAAAVDTAARRKSAVVGLAVAVGLLTMSASGLEVYIRSQQGISNVEQAREDAVVAARQAIINLDSLSAVTIDADLKRVVAGATGSFKDQFTKAQAELKQVVVARKTVSTGTILSAGLVRADTDSATVLVAVDRTVKDTSNKDGVVAHDRWKLDLEKHGGRWLVADLQPVS